MRIILLIGVAGVLLFFGLTRTQVGRDGIRNQLVAHFNAQFGGTLQIAQLTGNLVHTLFAQNIRISDPDGRLVLSIDSVIIGPNWRNLFRRTISTGHITLLRPKFYLYRDQENQWNLSKTFRRTTDGVSSSPWSFSVANIELIDGTLFTESVNVPQLVSDSLVFNFAESHATDLAMRAVVELRPASRHLEVRDFSCFLPDLDLALSTFRGQFVQDKDGLSLNGIEVNLGRSNISLTASADTLIRLDNETIGNTILDVEIEPSYIALEELHRILPRMPLSDTVRISAHIYGPISNLAVENLSVEKGLSGLSAEGTVVGFPDSLQHEFDFLPSIIRTEDVASLLPHVYVPDIGEIQFDGATRGVITFSDTTSSPFIRSDTRFSVQSDAGEVSSELTLTRVPGRPLKYSLSSQSLQLDVGQLVGDAAYTSRLNGVVALYGEHFSAKTADVSMSIGLSASTFASRQIDSLHVDISGVGGQYAGRAFFRQQQGALFLTADLDLNDPVPSLRLDASSRRMDFGQVLLYDSLSTNINAVLSVRGSGSDWDDVAGNIEVSFDSSYVALNDDKRTITPSRSTLTLAQLGSGTPRVNVSGDVAELQINGDVALPALFALSRHWYHTLSSAVAREIAKSYESPSAGLPLQRPYQSASDSADTADLYLQAVRQLELIDLDQLSVETHLHVLRSDILSAFMPASPRVGTNLQFHLNLSASPDFYTLRSTLTADSLHAATVKADSFLVDIDAQGHLFTSIEENLSFQLTSDASYLQIAGARFRSPGLYVQYENKQTHFDLASVENGPTGPFHVSGRLDITPQYNRLTFSDVYIAATDYKWTFPENINPEDIVIDFYQNAIVIPDIVLINRSVTTGEDQRIRAVGTFSRTPEDTLSVDLENIRLHQLSDFFSLQRPIGGTLNGQIAINDVFYRPNLTGSLRVDALSLENRVLGELAVTSRFLPGENDAGLDLYLSHAETDPAESLLQDIDQPISIEDNDIRLVGTFRLPQFDVLGQMVDPGQMDLDLEANRADAFFLEYIFNNVVTNVNGYFSGNGTIEGHFRRPVFIASLDLFEGDFYVPKFNLECQAEGRFHIGRDGITVEGASIQDAGGGEMLVTGDILFNDYRFFSFDLQGEMDRLQIMNMLTSRDLPFYGQIWTSGTVTLTGPIYDTTLRTSNGVTSPESIVLIPLTESESILDPGFIIIADSTGQLPDLQGFMRRDNVLARRPTGERSFLDGMDMDLNIFAPEGSTVQLVIDPLLGDIINAVGSGQIQIQRNEGEFSTFGSLEVTSGDYLFTAGDVFFRRFLIEDGIITWDGDPLNAVLDINASYRTRASSAGLNISIDEQTLIPLIVHLHVTNRVESPVVDLRLEIDRNNRNIISGYEGLEAALNQPERATEYATSVLLTNSFLLTTALTSESEITTSGNQLAFNSLSQLVASQLNRYVNQAIPNLDLNLGVQQGDHTQDLGVTYGIALRFLDERLIIRGQGIYQNTPTQSTQQNWLDEFVVEVRLTPDVSVEVFYRRENDILTTETFTNTTGAGLSYETRFPTWRRLLNRLFGWIRPKKNG